MKLGIINHYLVKEEDEGLLDLHLNQIEKHTKIPYTIYATVNRLSPKFREKLERHPKVKICECPTTSLRIGEEHVYYLEHLVEQAVGHGSSHVVSLHLDSFPIRSGWAEELAGRLSETRVFAAPSYGAYTACLFFHRDFYLKYRPTFFVPEEERSSEKYMVFSKEFEFIPHAGAGYFFRAYSEGLTWYPLVETNKGNALHSYICNIYDDLIFHLGAIWTYYEYEFHKNASFIQARKWIWRRFWFPILRILLLSKEQQKALGGKRLFIPRHLMGTVWKHIGFPFFFAPILWDERRQFLENPESYLNYLRTGKRQK